MGSICKQQTNINKTQELKIDFKNQKSLDQKDQIKRNTETSGGTLQYNQSSTKQFSIKRDPLARFMDQSISSSDSEEDPNLGKSPSQQVFTNFVTFQALPSQKQTKPKFEFLQDQFRNEMQQLQSLQQSKKQF